MNPTLLKNKSNILFLILIVFIYVLLTIVSLNNGYFWDNIQQISKEAHWYYLNDFKSLLIPAHSGSEVAATGYHPPLMGIMTAALWKVFGYKLWVSHILVFFWAIVLIYNIWKLIQSLFPENYVGWVVFILLIESSLLAQFAIGSPDFILFTAFVISLRAILENKTWTLSVGFFFLCCINMRGVFVGAILFFVHLYFIYLHKEKKSNFSSLIKFFLPYLPTFILLATYYIYYFSQNGWFFNGSSNTGHYTIPQGTSQIIKHFAEFGLRSVENGRFIIWLTGIYIAFVSFKSGLKLSLKEKVLLLFLSMLLGLYLLFIFITQMPFSARYFMPQFFLLTVLTLLGLIKYFDKLKIKVIFFVFICFELTGNLWIYPEQIAKSWDCTLGHMPYYKLRKNCFNYIDNEKIDYHNISSGFCLYGKRDYVELNKNENAIGNNYSSKYYIYSNISNVPDSMSDALHNLNKWTPIKSFKSWPVFITIYRNSLYTEKVKP